MLQTMETLGNLPTQSSAPTENPEPTEPHELTADTFEAFFDVNAKRLYRAMYLVVCDVAEAEDLAQEAFVRVWERWDRVKTMIDPAGYLYRTAMNLHRSRWRRRGVQAKHADAQGRTRSDPLEEVNERDMVVRALGMLPKRMRAALALMDYLGYGSEEAARILGVRPSTVRSLASQGRTMLRERMEDGERHG